MFSSFSNTLLKSVKRTRKLLQSAFLNVRQEREITFFYTFALVSMTDNKKIIKTSISTQ